MFVFSLHDTRIKFRTRTRISFGMKTGMNSFRSDFYMNVFQIITKSPKKIETDIAFYLSKPTA